MANELALRLDRQGLAEMSCIAGVGGDVSSLVKVATSGRPIVALDGCLLECTLSALRRHGVTPTEHVRLDLYGVRKRKHADFDRDHADRLLPIAAEAAERAATPRPNETEERPAQPRSTPDLPLSRISA